MEQVSATNAQVGSELQAVLNRLDGTNQQVQAILVSAGEQLGTIEAQLADQSQNLREALDTAARDSGTSTAILTDQIKTLRDVSTHVLRDINSIASQFEHHTEAISNANSHLQATNETVDQNMAERREALESIAAGLASNAQAVEERLSNLTSVLSNTLNNAEERITALSESLSQRTGESTQRATGMLETTLASADERIAAISEALGQRAEEAARSAIGQFETMRLAATAEGKRAVESVESARAQPEEQLNQASNRSDETVKAAAQSLLEEISKAIGDATTRFGETAEDMRKAARDLQSELDETRSELRKGILDLPDEARETTSAMRQAISEQIEAINELSRLVARYAPDLDASPPPAPAQVASVPSQLSAATPAEEKPAIAAVTRAPRRDIPKAVRQPEVLEEPAEIEEPVRVAGAAGGATANAGAAVPGSLGTDAAGQAHARANFDMRPPVRPQRRPSAPEQGESGRFKPSQSPRSGTGEARGWVADLLRRASSDEEPAKASDSTPSRNAPPAPSGDRRSPSQVVDSLNSLSVDIARAIDHEASVELWDRYKKGERNVFTRRLYTLQGQKTFDEIRRKYERDNDFQNAVNQYIDDFERLLRQVSQNDEDQVMSQMYLTSDTGKVYTMLAHAAGRLS